LYILIFMFLGQFGCASFHQETSKWIYECYDVATLYIWQRDFWTWQSLLLKLHYNKIRICCWFLKISITLYAQSAPAASKHDKLNTSNRQNVWEVWEVHCITRTWRHTHSTLIAKMELVTVQISSKTDQLPNYVRSGGAVVFTNCTEIWPPLNSKNGGLSSKFNKK
jgi:hypothetical protein